MGTSAGVEALFDGVDAAIGRLDGLVANAGVVAPLARVEQMQSERIEQVLRTNVVGTLLCAGAAVRRMSTRHGGSGGVIETSIHAPGRLERVVPGLPMKRAGTAEEVAAAIVWLLSPEASYVTGTLLDVGGGR